MALKISDIKRAHWLVRYLLAVLLSSAAISALFIPVVGKGLVFGMFAAVLASSWLGGVGPGLLAATILEAFVAVIVYLEGRLLSIAKLMEVTGFFAIGVLIAVMMQAVQKARSRAEAGQQWLEAVLTSIGDAVIATDASGRVSFINPVAESLCGWPGGEAAGRPIEEVFRIVNEFTREPAENPVQRVLAEGLVVGLANHTVLIARDGAERPIAESAAPIRDADRRLAGVVLVFRDVTERRRYEAGLLDEARRKDEFLATLAHELRNPLAAVSNAVQIIQQPEAAEHLDWCKSMLDRQVRHMTRLVDDLLDVSRISRGKIRLKPQRVDLAALLHSAAASVAPMAEERGHTLELSIAPESIPIDADPTRLEQVVVNLLANAIKYTKSDGRIELRAALDTDHVEIRIRDNGIGIPGELLPRVFELFTQGDRSAGRAEGGLGIGLSMVQKLVALHGGTVAVESDGPDRGSTFIVRLPATGETGRAPDVTSPVAAVAAADRHEPPPAGDR